ncbi:type II toxin-antitoxin system TacA family antitoxin [Endothiovibrio diazotrophicus]
MEPFQTGVGVGRSPAPDHLIGQDWERFLDALENPPAPNDRLREAFAQHRKRVAR